MTPQQIEHNKLVENMAKAICEADEEDSGLWDHICEREPFPRFWEGSLTTRDDYRKQARVALATAATHLNKVTPEMKGKAMMAWLGYSLPRGIEYEDGQSVELWRAMLAASPLVTGGEG